MVQALRRGQDIQHMTTDEKRSMLVYGVPSIEDYTIAVMDSITYKVSGGHMVVAGLMSDAQELMAAGHDESARKTLNIAKSILFRIKDGDLVGTPEGTR